MQSEDVAESAAAAGYVVRVAVIPPGEEKETAFQKELQALVAYLKLTPLAPEPQHNTLVTIDAAHQPHGLCAIDCYYVLSQGQSCAVVTVMPRGKPLIDSIEEELIAASERPGEQQPRQLDLIVEGMSQLAMGLKTMHDKGVYWRDCKVDNVVLLGGRYPSAGFWARLRVTMPHYPAPWRACTLVRLTDYVARTAQR